VNLIHVRANKIFSKVLETSLGLEDQLLRSFISNTIRESAPVITLGQI
jgi:hypothetical protein